MTDNAIRGTGRVAPVEQARRGAGFGKVAGTVVLFAGALLFLFPFYYMVVGSLQKEPDTTIGGTLPSGDLTLDNYSQINSRVDLVGSLVNSGIFTGGVLLCT